jgi:hypothetical protein
VSESSTIEEVDECDSSFTGEESVRLDSLNEINNCKLFTIFEDNEDSLEERDLELKEVKGGDFYKYGHHI